MPEHARLRVLRQCSPDDVRTYHNNFWGLMIRRDPRILPIRPIPLANGNGISTATLNDSAGLWAGLMVRTDPGGPEFFGFRLFRIM